MSTVNSNHLYSFINVEHISENSYPRANVSPAVPMPKLKGTPAKADTDWAPLPIKPLYMPKPLSSHKVDYPVNSELQGYIRPFSVEQSKKKRLLRNVSKLPKIDDYILSIVKHMCSIQQSITIGEYSEKHKSIFKSDDLNSCSYKIKLINLGQNLTPLTQTNYFDMIYTDKLKIKLNIVYNILKENGILILKVKISDDKIIEKLSKDEKKQPLYKKLKKLFEDSMVDVDDFSSLYKVCQRLLKNHFKNPTIQRISRSDFDTATYLIRVQKQKDADTTSSTILVRWTEVAKAS